MDSDLKVSLGIGLLVAVLMFWLGSCAAPPDYPEIVDVEDTATLGSIATIVSSTPTFAPTETLSPTSTDTPSCPPRHLEGLTVGYIPALDLGGKQSAVSVELQCGLLAIWGDGWSISGVVSDDGLSLASCTLYADRQYTCDLRFRNVDNLNVAASYTNKAGKDYTICLASDYTSFNEECE